uniref:Uncharacterized protein n=1 Tax=Anguilla anguilla TaxID=7936 RepID=A0A0E9ULY0_ANGAN
MWLGQCHLFL